MVRNERVDTLRDADHADIGLMDIARRVVIAMTSMKNAFVPFKKLRQTHKIRLPKQQMHRLHRQMVIALQRLLLPPLLGRARGRGKEREKARKAKRISTVNIKKYRLV